MPSSSRARSQLILPFLVLLVATAGLLAWRAQVAAAANQNVTFATGGSCGVLGCECEAGSYAFAPETLRVNPGDTVTFTNPSGTSDSHPCTPEAHPSTCVQGGSKGDCPFGSFLLPTGSSHGEQFPDEGTFFVRCNAHPYMDITVTVGDGVPDEPDPEPTEPDEPDPQPTEPDDPEPTEDEQPDSTEGPSETGSPSPGPATPTATDAATPLPTPSVSADPISQPEVVVGGDDDSRGPLLIVATTLLGFAIGGLLWTRELFAR